VLFTACYTPKMGKWLLISCLAPVSPSPPNHTRRLCLFIYTILIGMLPHHTTSSSTRVRMPGGEVVCKSGLSRIVRGKEEGAIGLGRRHVSYGVSGLRLRVGKVLLRNIVIATHTSRTVARLLGEMRHRGARGVTFNLNVLIVVNKGGDGLAGRLCESVVNSDGRVPYHRGAGGEGGRA
jgi:hypothetical protein